MGENIWSGDKGLCEYAASNTSKLLNGRVYPHNKDLRLEYQRDRDRIIHSRAFRRLQGKTQVFSPEKGDHFRNRLTHTLEVSQIGRTIGRVLLLNEDLIEAISLGHDLGHTPFGHSGEKILHEIITGKNSDERLDFNLQGGFKHNFQSLYIVDSLEMSGEGNRGLNLTLAVREGIIKHTCKTMKIEDGKDSIDYENLDLENMYMDQDFSITLEGQVVALADEIAQSTHDLEDGIRAGIIDINILISKLSDKLKELEEKTNEDCKKKEKKFFDYFKEELEPCLNIGTEDAIGVRNNLIRKLINLFIIDTTNYSKNTIKRYNHSENIESQDKTYIIEECLIENSKYVKIIREFLNHHIFESVISSQEIAQSDSKSKYLIRQIFKAYYEEPLQLPDYILERYYGQKGKKLERLNVYNDKAKIQKDLAFIRSICDHIAGMTDRYALSEYNKLYGTKYQYS